MSIEIIKSSDTIDQIFGTPGSQENKLLDQYREAVRVEAEARFAADKATDLAEKAQIDVRVASRARQRLQEELEEAFPVSRPMGRRNFEAPDSEQGFYGRNYNRSSMYAPRDRFATKQAHSNNDAYKGFKLIFSEARDSQETVFLRARLDPQGPTDLIDALVRLDIPGKVGSLALMKYRGEEIIVVVGARALGNVVIHTEDGIVVVHAENGYSVLKNPIVSSAYVLAETIQYVRERA